MSSSTTKVMAIRVKNETADFFRGKPLNRVVESVHDLYKKDELGITASGNVFVPSSNNKREDNSV